MRKEGRTIPNMTENHIIHDLDDMIYGNAHVIHSER